MNNKLKTVMAILLIAVAVAVAGVWAATTFTGGVDLNIGVDTNFYVTDDTGTTTLTSPYTETVTTTGTHVFTYRVYNDGNVDISISMSATDNLPAGATAVWTQTFPLTVAQEAYEEIELTITATQLGSGSYSWVLSSSAA